eukprot:gene12379-12513_t
MVANRTGNALYIPIFSGVYFDKGGGEIWMDTFSVPVPGPDGKLAAVATADIREQPPSLAAVVTAPVIKSAAGATLQAAAPAKIVQLEKNVQLAPPAKIVGGFQGVTAPKEE